MHGMRPTSEVGGSLLLGAAAGVCASTGSAVRPPECRSVLLRLLLLVPLPCRKPTCRRGCCGRSKTACWGAAIAGRRPLLLLQAGTRAQRIEGHEGVSRLQLAAAREHACAAPFMGSALAWPAPQGHKQSRAGPKRVSFPRAPDGAAAALARARSPPGSRPRRRRRRPRPW